MKNQTVTYTDGPIKKTGKTVVDFLPAPEDLVFKQKTTKVTIALSDKSIAFFKKKAEKYNTQYQKMIRELLDEYVQQHG